MNPISSYILPLKIGRFILKNRPILIFLPNLRATYGTFFDRKGAFIIVDNTIERQQGANSKVKLPALEGGGSPFGRASQAGSVPVNIH